MLSADTFVASRAACILVFDSRSSLLGLQKQNMKNEHTNQRSF